MPPLSVKQVASRLGVSIRTIHAWIKRGHFPNAYKLDPTSRNSPYAIPEHDVRAFEAQRKQN